MNLGWLLMGAVLLGHLMLLTYVVGRRHGREQERRSRPSLPTDLYGQAGSNVSVLRGKSGPQG